MEERKCRRRKTDTPVGRLIDTYMQIWRLHRNVLERGLNGTGVYRSQHQLLMYIADHPNLSQKEIARQMQVSAATVAVSLKKLESGAYIRRVVDQADNRYNQICITEKGQKVVEHSICFFNRLETRLFDGFSEQEMGEFQGYLDRMLENLASFLPEEREGQE